MAVAKGDSKLAEDEAFGIIPVVQEGVSYHFLLIQHNAGHWGFPKGHADPGESALQAACREFVEETGIADYTVFDEIFFREQYFFKRRGQKFRKTVVYFPALVRTAIVSCQKEEIQAYAWLSYEQAIDRLTFNGGRQVLIDAHQYFSQRISR